jgi:hypothetical protein
MSGEPESHASTSQASDQSLVQKLLIWLDGCRADKAPTDRDGQRGAVQAIERHLAKIVPTTEADLFALAARLSDKAFAPATRERIVANVARAAALMVSRRQRLVSSLTSCNGSVADLRKAHSDALGWLLKGIELTRLAQANAANATNDHAAVAPVVVGIEAALDELEAVRWLLELMDSMFEDAMAQLKGLVADEAAETAVFEEAVSATAH